MNEFSEILMINMNSSVEEIHIADLHDFDDLDLVNVLTHLFLSISKYNQFSTDILAIS